MGKGKYGTCPECLKRGDRRKKWLTEHHKVPRSKGGSDSRKNKVYVCRACHDQLDILARPEKMPKPQVVRLPPEVRLAFKMEVKSIQKCRPNPKKCHDCKKFLCVNIDWEALAIFFKWLQEAYDKWYAEITADVVQR